MILVLYCRSTVSKSQVQVDIWLDLNLPRGPGPPIVRTHTSNLSSVQVWTQGMEVWGLNCSQSNNQSLEVLTIGLGGFIFALGDKTIKQNCRARNYNQQEVFTLPHLFQVGLPRIQIVHMEFQVVYGKSRDYLNSPKFTWILCGLPRIPCNIFHMEFPYTPPPIPCGFQVVQEFVIDAI